jgi:hypothetical protein
MADCNGKFIDLTPYEAYRCIIDAEVWNGVGQNPSRMWWETTIGDWIQIIFAIALAPAQLASYIFPFLFLVALVRKLSGKHLALVDDKSRRAKNFWGAYMLVSAACVLFIGNGDTFMPFTGIWEAICGLTIFVLGPSWWARSSAEPAKASW